MGLQEVSTSGRGKWGRVSILQQRNSVHMGQPLMGLSGRADFDEPVPQQQDHRHDQQARQEEEEAVMEEVPWRKQKEKMSVVSGVT